jgi:hypothetical protein
MKPDLETDYCDSWVPGEHAELSDKDLQRAEIRAVEILAPLRLGDPLGLNIHGVEMWLDTEEHDYEHTLEMLEPDRALHQFNGGGITHPDVERMFAGFDKSEAEQNDCIFSAQLARGSAAAIDADGPEFDLSDEEMVGWRGWETRYEPETVAEAAGWLARQIFEHYAHHRPPNPWHTPLPWQSDDALNPKINEHFFRLGGWDGHGVRALVDLCTATCYELIVRCAKQVIFYWDRYGTLEVQHWWLLEMDAGCPGAWHLCREGEVPDRLWRQWQA